MLLDTHVLLWFLEDHSNLPLSIKEVIENSDEIWVSIVSLWEISIKLSIHKLTLQFQFQTLPDLLSQLEIGILTLSFEDINHYLSLSLHHRDPFDRILIAQAINRSMPIASADAVFDAYSVQRIWT
jgi:PIN domain nuclease of toxin-antitoxin system